MSQTMTLSRTELTSRLVRATSALALGAALALGPVGPAFSQQLAAQAERPESFADLAEMVSPAVVNITTETVVAGRAGPPGLDLPEDSPFRDFFGRPDDNNNRRSSALGSGFVISADGYIVTNNHVIEGADEIEIEFFPEEGKRSRRLAAKVIGTDEKTDIALLKVESDTPLAYVKFGDSDGEDAEVGDWVLAMGNPLGQGFSISAGIVSARGRSLGKTYDDYIQTDAAINRGNSGGPLFSMAGEVIGVNTAILSPSGGSIGIGFAQASDVVSKVVDQLKEFGETRRGWLGVRIQNVTADMVDAIEGLDEPLGAMVTDVPEGPAREAGIEAGDVILTFNGVEVADTRELVAVVADAAEGEVVPVDLLRAGKEITLEVKLGRRETAEGASEQAPMEPQVADILGLTLAPVTPELAEEYGLSRDKGLVVLEVEEGSEAEDKGLQAGDLITEAGQRKIETLDDLDERIDESREAGRKSLLLLIRRGDAPRFVALPLD